MPKFTPPRIICVTYVLSIPAPLKITVPYIILDRLNVDYVTSLEEKKERNTHVVEEVVGTGQLLQSLKHNAKYDAVRHAWRLEHLKPPADPASCPLLGIQLFLDLGNLMHNDPMILGYTIQFRHGASGAVHTAIAVVESRTLREEEDAETKDKTPQECDPEWDSPRGGVVYALCAEVDAVCDEDAQCYE